MKELHNVKDPRNGLLTLMTFSFHCYKDTYEALKEAEEYLFHDDIFSKISNLITSKDPNISNSARGFLLLFQDSLQKDSENPYVSIFLAIAESFFSIAESKALAIPDPVTNIGILIE